MRAVGHGNLKVLVGSGRTLEGPAVFTSAGPAYKSSITFDVSDYPAEIVSFDGDTSYVNQLNPGQRSTIGDFLYQYEEILTEGLFGGTLSTGWALLHYDQNKSKLKHKGLRNQRGTRTGHL